MSTKRPAGTGRAGVGPGQRTLTPQAPGGLSPRQTRLPDAAAHPPGAKGVWLGCNLQSPVVRSPRRGQTVSSEVTPGRRGARRRQDFPKPSPLHRLPSGHRACSLGHVTVPPSALQSLALIGGSGPRQQPQASGAQATTSQTLLGTHVHVTSCGATSPVAEAKAGGSQRLGVYFPVYGPPLVTGGPSQCARAGGTLRECPPSAEPSTPMAHSVPGGPSPALPMRKLRLSGLQQWPHSQHHPCGPEPGPLHPPHAA